VTLKSPLKMSCHPPCDANKTTKIMPSVMWRSQHHTKNLVIRPVTLTTPEKILPPVMWRSKHHKKSCHL
jgi:hypothetical protein